MASTSQDIVIHNSVIKPGENRTIMLPMPKLYNWTPMTMPVHIFNGKHPGPKLCITSAVHGDELNGTEILRRLMKKPFLKKLSGALICVPIVNIYGFLYMDRYLMDRRDLNRAFPGSEKGSLAARLANLVMKELVSNATHMLDLHTGSFHRSNLPQIRANLDLPGVSDIANAFHPPVMIDAKERDGSLRQSVNDKGIPILLFEAGEALRLDEFSIRTGLKGITNVMKHLGMIANKSKKSPPHPPAIAKFTAWVRAPYSGMLRPFKQLGKQVKKGELLGVITNPSGAEEYELISPISGIIIGKTNLPLVHAGAALFHIASFEEPSKVKENIESMQETVFDHYDMGIDELVWDYSKKGS